MLGSPQKILGADKHNAKLDEQEWVKELIVTTYIGYIKGGLSKESVTAPIWRTSGIPLATG